MTLHQKIVTARKKKGLTQEQLADLSNITVRTIQRIESGETTPRAYTVKTIAAVLDTSFEELTAEATSSNEEIDMAASFSKYSKEDKIHFLKMLCLSCFSYLVIPFIHFLVPVYLLKKYQAKDPALIAFSRKLIRGQLYWQCALSLLLFSTLAYNMIKVTYFQKTQVINYLLPFFMMYIINAILIGYNLWRINKIDFSSHSVI